jgi:hypothetical protein
LSDGAATVGESDFDLEGGAAMDGRGTRGGIVKLPGDDSLEPRVEELASDRDNAIRGRGADLGLLEGLVEPFGFRVADFDGRGPR